MDRIILFTEYLHILVGYTDAEIYMVRFKARQQLMASIEKKIFCEGHCVKSINPREKRKYVPEK